MKSIWVLLLVAVCATGTFSQNTITGKIIDDSSGEALIGATIRYKDSGVLSDYNGSFSIEVDDITIPLQISYVGYSSQELLIADVSEAIEVRLRETQTILETATITGSRFDRKLSEAVVSIDVIKSDFIDNGNTQTMSKLLDKVPGVQIIDGQANIRGGSGFSFGAGSRVMLLLNDIPFLQPDAGYSNWTDLPVESVAQVEVLKGSSSALYGSAALNGIVNMRTKYATSTPETKLSVSYGQYMDPSDEDKRYWIKNSPDTTFYNFAISGLHRQKIGEDLDVVFSGYNYKLRSYNDSTYQNRYRWSTSLKYRLTDRLTIGLYSLYNFSENSSFFIWKNGGTKALQGSSNAVSVRSNTRYIIDPSVHYYDKYNNRHKLLFRYYNLNNDNSLDQGNTSQNYYSEYQIQRRIENLSLDVTGGLVNQYLTSDSELFSNAKFNAKNYAAYLQADYRGWERATLSLGGRYEFNELNVPRELTGDTITREDLSDGEFIGKAGINLGVTEQTFLRASLGQGYRFPTVVERFIETTFSNFFVFPNPTLLPEYGWSAELGIKQGFDLLGLQGFVDIAFFNQRYLNMMEFTFVIDGTRSGFQSQNVGDTQTTGVEFGIGGKASIGDLGVNVFGGYTYLDPIYKDFETNEEIQKSLSTNSVDGPVNVLKYRSKHMLKLDAEITSEYVVLGLNAQYSSHVINVDDLLTKFADIAAYRAFRNKGYLLLTPRLSFHYADSKLSFHLNNMLNQEYTVRPGLIEPPRNWQVRFDQTF